RGMAVRDHQRNPRLPDRAMTMVWESRAFLRYRLASVLAGLAVTCAGARAARAQTNEVDEPTPQLEPEKQQPARAATGAGAFLPQTLSAQVGSVPVFALGSGG